MSSAANESESRGSIVIADDDDATRMLLQQVLTKAGFTVHACENGKILLDAVHRERPDVILLDWMMPVMDGRVTAERLKADPATRDIPVVMLTTQSQIEDRVTALKSGVQDILAKPFDARELIARIDQQVRWRKMLAVDANTAFAADRLKLYRSWETAPQPPEGEANSSFFDRIWGSEPKRWAKP